MDDARRAKVRRRSSSFLQTVIRIYPGFMEIKMFDFKRAVEAAAHGFSRLFTAYLARRAVMPLLYANERVLRDIGLSRADVVDCLSGSLAADPSRLLMTRINARAEATRTPQGTPSARPKVSVSANDAKPRQPLAA
jgi:uncharacterized protein YjiS (DUF1127 family)